MVQRGNICDWWKSITCSREKTPANFKISLKEEELNTPFFTVPLAKFPAREEDTKVRSDV